MGADQALLALASLRLAKRQSVLVVDDDPDMCWVLKVTIELLGHSVITAPSGHQALEAVRLYDFPLAFIDARLPDMDGLQLASEIRAVQRSQLNFQLRSASAPARAAAYRS